MNIIVGSYEDFENRLLVAAYYTSNILDKDIVTIEEIISHFSFDINERFARTSIKEFYDRGINRSKSHFGDISEQYIQLSADGMKEAEYLIKNNLTDVNSFRRKIVERRDPIAIDSSKWTGLPKVGVLSASASERLQSLLKTVEGTVEQSGLSNAEKSQARAYVVAMTALADAPEPPAELIYMILMVAASVSAIGSFFADVVQLFS